MLTPSPRKPLQIAPNPLLGFGPVKTVKAEEIAAPGGLIRSRHNDRRVITYLKSRETAEQAVAPLTLDNELCLLSKGQFGLLSLIEALLAKTGPAHMTISTWTAARFEIARLQELKEQGLLLSARWLIDLSFSRRDPAAANQIRLAFGLDAMRVTQIHAKVTLLTNDSWRLVLRTSANLNMNIRVENFDIAHDPELFDFYEHFITDIFNRQNRKLADGPSRDAQRFFRDQM
jgi:hypothetical protein